jgi:hypothetical protein
MSFWSAPSAPPASSDSLFATALVTVKMLVCLNT